MSQAFKGEPLTLEMIERQMQQIRDQRPEWHPGIMSVKQAADLERLSKTEHLTQFEKDYLGVLLAIYDGYWR